jgi:hypothetical protein
MITPLWSLWSFADTDNEILAHIPKGKHGEVI